MLELKPEYKLLQIEIKKAVRKFAKGSKKIFRQTKANLTAFINRLKKPYKYNYFTIKECQKLQQKFKSNKRYLKAL
ncbi:hypothetical protein [Campylobacter sp. RM12637]|uniref:hypothetical protein n=1 Tax=Campylobacter sp. RM12637 TaxID=2735734 RepID=UPI00301501F0|nr:hypothetical protein [Campylobacter sp. RM12637]